MATSKSKTIRANPLDAISAISIEKVKEPVVSSQTGKSQRSSKKQSTPLKVSPEVFEKNKVLTLWRGMYSLIVTRFPGKLLRLILQVKNAQKIFFFRNWKSCPKKINMLLLP